MKIRTKLVLAFLACGILPLLVASVLSYRTANSGMSDVQSFGNEALEKTAYNQLIALRDVKKGQVETYFAERQDDMGMLSETVEMLRNESFDKLQAIQTLKKDQVEIYIAKLLLDMEVFARSRDTAELYDKLIEYHIATNTRPDGSYDVSTREYQKIWEKDGANALRYFNNSGVYDIFMICADHGHIMYTCAKESDLGENLGYGQLKNSNLAKLWKMVKTNDGRAVIDFEPYAPSNGDQAAFAGAPIRDENGKTHGMMVVQIPIDQLNKIVQQRTGMGKTGESYLVGKSSDGQNAYRSDRVLKEGKVGQLKSDQFIEQALAGGSGNAIKVGSTGAVEILRYDPVNAEGLNWCMISSVRLDEVISPALLGEQKDFFAKYLEMHGYYDLFLIHPSGQVFYSVCQEADYQTNMVNGVYKDSNLGELVWDVLASKEFGFADFAPYAPSNGTPAAFIAQPIVQAGEVELIVALQLPLDTINKIMGCVQAWAKPEKPTWSAQTS